MNSMNKDSQGLRKLCAKEQASEEATEKNNLLREYVKYPCHLFV
jgi:hypothetical protein